MVLKERMRAVARTCVHVTPARDGTKDRYDVSLCWPVKKPLWSTYYVVSTVEAAKAEATADLLRETMEGVADALYTVTRHTPKSDS